MFAATSLFMVTRLYWAGYCSWHFSYFAFFFHLCRTSFSNFFIRSHLLSLLAFSTSYSHILIYSRFPSLFYGSVCYSSIVSFALLLESTSQQSLPPVQSFFLPLSLVKVQVSSFSCLLSAFVKYHFRILKEGLALSPTRRITLHLANSPHVSPSIIIL